MDTNTLNYITGTVVLCNKILRILKAQNNGDSVNFKLK